MRENFRKKNKSDKNKYMYNCNCKISHNDKNFLVQDIHYTILYTTLTIYKYLMTSVHTIISKICENNDKFVKIITNLVQNNKSKYK